MKAVAFDGLEYLFFFLLFSLFFLFLLFFIFFIFFIFVDLVKRLRVRLEIMYENYDRQNIAGHISNNDICVGDDIDVTW